MRTDARHRRHRILTEAKGLFAEHGSEIALETIAAASGVGIATLYRNFPSREELIVAVVLDILGDIDAVVGSAHAALSDSPSRAWDTMVRALVDLNLGALTDAFGGPRWGNLSDEISPAQDTSLGTLNALLKELATRGVIRESLSAFDVVVAVGILTRPQPEAIRRATPHLVEQLTDAFLAWSRPADSLRT